MILSNKIKQLNSRDEKAQFLRELSKELKPLVERCEFESINEALESYYKTETETTVFKTFKSWLNDGFKVKKGEKGFPIWGKPIKINNNQETDESKKASFFPISYIYNNKQVEPLNN